MGIGERIADETAAHYDALRERRLPCPLAWLMAWRYHEMLTRTVLLDDAFEDTIKRLLAPLDVPTES